jgi:hypothetical protein
MMLRYMLYILLATVPNHRFGSWLEPNIWQIGGSGHEYTRNVTSDTVQCNSSSPSELGGLSVGYPAATSLDSYYTHVFAV